MLGAIIGAGASLAGGLLGKSSADKANKTQAKLAQQNIDLQKQFAQSGIRWKVADAKAAGIHPLAALGAQTTSFAPVSVGHTSDNFGSSIAAAGQDISRAIDAGRTSTERLDAYSQSLRALQLQRAGLENELLSAQIAKVRQAGQPPARPSLAEVKLVDGQGDSPLVKTEPMERQASDPTNTSIEAGVIPEVGYGRTPTGWSVAKSKDMQERLEDDFIGTAAWSIRNRIPQIIQRRLNPPFAAPAGTYWWFDPVRQEYQLYPGQGAGRFSSGAIAPRYRTRR